MMRRAVMALAALAGLALLLVGCSDDDADPAATATTRVAVALGAPLALGETYEDPSGNATLTVRDIRVTGGLLLADAQACAAAGTLNALPVLPTAWQLRIVDGEETIARVTLDPPGPAARPPWPDTAELAAGECVEGNVAFRVPAGAEPAEVLFTQLPTPVAWSVPG